MVRLTRWMKAFLWSDSGATATEYAVMIALIIVVAIGAVSAMGDKVSETLAEAHEGW